jgi:hypothetical protein
MKAAHAVALGGIFGMVVASFVGYGSGHFKGYQAASISRTAVGDFNSDGNSNDVAYVQNDGKTNIVIYTPRVEIDGGIDYAFSSYTKPSRTNIVPTWTPLEKLQSGETANLAVKQAHEAKTLENKFKDIQAKAAGALK